MMNNTKDKAEIYYMLTESMQIKIADFLDRLDVAAVSEIIGLGEDRKDSVLWGRGMYQDYQKAIEPMTIDYIYDTLMQLRDRIRSAEKTRRPEMRELSCKVRVTEDIQRVALCFFLRFSGDYADAIYKGKLGKPIKGQHKLSEYELEMNQIALFFFFDQILLPHGFCLE